MNDIHRDDVLDGRNRQSNYLSIVSVPRTTPEDLDLMALNKVLISIIYSDRASRAFLGWTFKSIDIYRILGECRAATAGAIGSKANIPEATVHRILTKFKDAGLIERVGYINVKKKGGPRPSLWGLIM